MTSSDRECRRDSTEYRIENARIVLNIPHINIYIDYCEQRPHFSYTKSNNNVLHYRHTEKNEDTTEPYTQKDTVFSYSKAPEYNVYNIYNI